MFRRTVSGIMLMLLLTGIFILAFNIHAAKAWTGTVYILPDGTTSPLGAPISTSDYVTYTLTGDIASTTDCLIIQRNGVFVDGNGHMLQGSGNGNGIYWSETDNVTIRNTQINAFHYGINFSYSSGNSIIGNKITNNSPRGIWLFNSSTNNIFGNNITNNKGGIDLERSPSNSINGNNITANSFGIFVDYSSDNSVSGNDITTNNYWGITLNWNSNNNHISGNMFTDDGLMTYGSYENSVDNNTVNGRPLVYLERVANYSVGDAGQVILVRCDSIRVENLDLYRASVGVELEETNNSNISGNNITANNYDGILLDVCSNNSIVGNYITNNYDGVELDDSSDNRFWHNNFIGNTDQQVYIGLSTDHNFWDDGYPNGGNNWSDYTGVDLKSGPNQDQAGSDGIGDTPYIIDGNNTDYYPRARAETPPIRVPEDYTSIQAAIDAATPWSTILIGPGVYNESVIVNKPLHIIGKLGSEPIWSGGGSGIVITLLSNASGTIIEGIVCTSWDVGILINNASNCTIYNTRFTLMSHSGILVEGNNAVNNIICNNMFQNSTVAVDLTSPSHSTTVYRNIISSDNVGIKLESTGNLVYANTILENNVGIDLSNSNSNVIYHNNLVNNTVEVSISTSTGNTWDDGYPSGGNYWSNSAHSDVYTGPNQNQLGADGIVDTPYTVAGSDVDRYPLAQPFKAHDVGITDYSMSKTVVGAGYGLSVEVKLLNYGVYDEDFHVTAYANASTAAAQAITLTKSNSLILTLTWNTSGFAHGNYTVTACAETVQDEADTSNNNCTCNPSVHVGVPGDVSSATQGVYDRTVNMRDISYLILLFNTRPAISKWNPNADINNDATVNMRDISIAILNFNKHE